MRALFALAVFASIGSAAAARASDNREGCAGILPVDGVATAKRPLQPMDLVRLRDIGPVDPTAFAAPFFSVSPDGRRIAFQLRQADPVRNGYCLAMVIIDITGREPPKVIDEGGEPILLTIDLRGLADFPTGIMRVITPRWSPDGRWIAFLKRMDGKTQVWRANADASGSGPLTHSDSDVVDFRLEPGGTALVFATRPDIDRDHALASIEGRSGWHYDERFFPFISREPFPKAPVGRDVKVLELASGHVRDPSVDEQHMADTDQELIATAGAAVPTENRALWIDATDLSGGAKNGALHARLPIARMATCARSDCAGAMSPWWMPDKRHVRFLRKEGWAKASTAIYDWDVPTGHVHRLYRTDDVLASCTPSGSSLLCLVDASLQPRRLVRLDPATGRRELLFDPNPEFSSLILGKVERLHWRNAFGIETLGDLVLPVGYQPGTKYPMVVVQYDTRGFLRGGTGDEYPIQALANRGFAVLSFRRPTDYGDQRGARDFEEAGRLDLEGFADRRSVQSSLEEGVHLAIRLGVADPARLGITGLSDGSTTVTWALIHSSLFAAAAMSTCCFDPTMAMQIGPSGWKHFHGEGYPGILHPDDPFWKDVAFSPNATRIQTPILLQLAEDEFLSGLQSYAALREAGTPVDLFEFPGEHHIKWQPAHRLAVYERSIDWFAYWLQGSRSTAGDRSSEISEWDRLSGRASAATLP